MAAAPVVLVLGGTCFQGRSLVGRVLKDLPEVDVVVANRGRTYWGVADPWGSPRVQFVRGDRDKDGFGGTLDNALTGRRVVGVVDFACFHPRHIHPLLPLLARWRAVYIFISTDSVYDVLRIPPADTTPHGIVEAASDLHRPAAARTRLALHRRCRYGGNKLRIEDVLHATPGLTWAALRLADVIGPMDDTGRFWATYLYASRCRDRMYMRSNVAATRACFTYSEDVGSVCLHLLSRYIAEAGASGAAGVGSAAARPPSAAWDSDSSSSDSSAESDDVSASEETAAAAHPIPEGLAAGTSRASSASMWCRAYNICCDEAVTVKAFVEMVASIAAGGEIGGQVATATPATRCWGTADYFPSVDCGPISNEAARGLLGFEPTPLEDVLRRTCEYFAEMTDVMLAPSSPPAGARPRSPEEWARVMRKLPQRMKARAVGGAGGEVSSSESSTDASSSSSSSSSCSPPSSPPAS